MFVVIFVLWHLFPHFASFKIVNVCFLSFRTLVQPNGPSVSGSSRNSSSRGPGGGAPRMGGFKRAGGPSAPPCGMGGGWG